MDILIFIAIIFIGYKIKKSIDKNTNLKKNELKLKEWINFVSPEKNWEVKFPYKPNLSKIIDMPKQKLDLYSAEHDKEEFGLVVATQNPYPADKIEDQFGFTFTLDAAVGIHKDKSIESLVKTAFKGHPAIQVIVSRKINKSNFGTGVSDGMIDSLHGKKKLLFFLRDKKLYCLDMRSIDEKIHNFDFFSNSFHFLD